MKHRQNGPDSCSCGGVWPCRRVPSRIVSSSPRSPAVVPAAVAAALGATRVSETDARRADSSSSAWCPNVFQGPTQSGGVPDPHMPRVGARCALEAGHNGPCLYARAEPIAGPAPDAPAALCGATLRSVGPFPRRGDSARAGVKCGRLAGHAGPHAAVLTAAEVARCVTGTPQRNEPHNPVVYVVHVYDGTRTLVDYYVRGELASALRAAAGDVVALRFEGRTGSLAEIEQVVAAAYEEPGVQRWHVRCDACLAHVDAMRVEP